MGDHKSLCIEVHESMLLSFWHIDIIPPMARNLRLGYFRMINKFNDTLHKRFLNRIFTIGFNIYTTELFFHYEHISKRPLKYLIK